MTPNTSFNPSETSLQPMLPWLLIAALGSLLLRVWISVAFPITGDEAFFYWWGVFPDWGYYDHPPMVGWLIAAMRWLVGDALWAIRLPVVLLPLALGGLLWWALYPLDRERAAWAVLLYWLTPLNWLNTLITTDTPLIFWSVLSAAFLMRAEQSKVLDRKAWLLYAASGVFLGCAFLSKYFAVVLGLAYLVYFLGFRRSRWPALLLLVLCALPGPAINIAWNMTHGWTNIMFNVYNRNQDASFAWSKPALFGLTLFYLVTPAVVWFGFVNRQSLLQAVKKYRLISLLWLLPMVFFALLSLKKVIGLHWVLSFYPFCFVLLAFALPAASLKNCAKGIAVFTALHVLAVTGIAMTSVEQWEGKTRYYSIVRAFKTSELLAQVQKPDAVLMADGYSPASVYGFVLGRYVPVFGIGKFHARQDDMLVDYSIYSGKTIRVLLSDAPVLTDFLPYFDSVEPFKVKISGVTFDGIEGKNFNFEAYRKGVLGEIFQRYYQIPQWLPMTGCPFCERYCGQVRCPP